MRPSGGRPRRQEAARRQGCPGGARTRPGPTWCTALTPGAGHSLASYALLGVLAIVAVVVAAWIVAGVLIGLLHALELLAVAAAAGWVGYRIGHYRGRRARP